MGMSQRWFGKVICQPDNLRRPWGAIECFRARSWHGQTCPLKDNNWPRGEEAWRLFGTLLQEAVHHTNRRVLNMNYVPRLVSSAGRMNWTW